MNPLVSIIIPTYNRAHLIGETIQSILDQTYLNWECIIVDDRSTDNTHIIVSEFVELDTRFHFYKRPELVLKGANTCRNIGLNKAKGKYIQFFDSDDLMISTFLSEKVVAIERNKGDFIISKTLDFIHPDSSKTINHYNYNFNLSGSLHFNYVTQRCNWLTPDALIKTEIAYRLKWNELLTRRQEYNFFVKLTLITNKVVFLDQYLTKRRLHEDSIKSSFTEQCMLKQAVVLRKLSLQEIYRDTTKQVQLWFVANLAKNATLVKWLSLETDSYIARRLLKFYGIRITFFYIAARLSKLFFNKNEFFRQPLKKIQF